MITISKKNVADRILLSNLAELRLLSDKIALFEKKYKTTLSEFENKIKTQKEENFEMWDDFIEWKAFSDFHKKQNK